MAGNLTIPAWLQDHLREALNRDDIYIYNFGTPLYTSLQEFWRFRGLVRDGFVPDMAIFIDGLNDFSFAETQVGIEPDAACQQNLDILNRFSNTIACRYDEVCLPVQELAVAIKAPETHLPSLDDLGIEIADTSTPADDRATNELVIERWLQTKQKVENLAETHGIELLFVMQPVPAYGYDLQYHLLIDDPEAYLTHSRLAYGYPIWDEMFADLEANWTHNTLNLTHLGEDNQGPLYVTLVHYTADFSNEIAQAISDAIVERELIARVE